MKQLISRRMIKPSRSIDNGGGMNDTVESDLTVRGAEWQVDLLKTMNSFVRVVRTGSFASAAEQLNVSRAIISKHIQHLESYLSARLLNRSTRSLSLTEIGKSYHEFCVRVLMQIEQERELILGLQSEPRGSLIVMAPKSFGNLFVGAAIADFVTLYPKINVSLLLQDGSPTSRDLIRRGVDLAIRISPLPDSAMISKQIGALRWIACASASYLKNHGVPRTPEDLVGHACLVHLKSTPDGVWPFEGAAGEEKRVKVTAAFSANSSLALRSAAVKSVGIALLPLYSVKDDLENGDLVEVLPGFRGPERPVIALYPHRPLLLTKVRLLIDFLEQKFRQKPEARTDRHRRRDSSARSIARQATPSGRRLRAAG